MKEEEAGTEKDVEAGAGAWKEIERVTVEEEVGARRGILLTGKCRGLQRGGTETGAAGAGAGVRIGAGAGAGAVMIMMMMMIVRRAKMSGLDSIYYGFRLRLGSFLLYSSSSSL